MGLGGEEVEQKDQKIGKHEGGSEVVIGARLEVLPSFNVTSSLSGPPSDLLVFL
jgi:hypothetical protein